VLTEDTSVLPLVAEDSVMGLTVSFEALVEDYGVSKVIVLAEGLGAGVVVDPGHLRRLEWIHLASGFYHGCGRT
jgi:hypothetical protein